MRDMMPQGDRSIRNIPVSGKHRRTPAPILRNDEDDYEEPPRLPRRRKRRLFWWIALGVVVVCGIGGVLLSTLFAGATVTVSPRSVAVVAPPTLNAQINAPAGTLSYQVVTTSRTASTTASATGQTQVSRQGSGIITIYNAYSTASQRLIANTRFEAPDGKFYRIRDSVIVPGATKASDGSLVPGSIAVSVYADSPGPDYNRGATTFTIPGFKGDPRYDKFYAQTDKISGGFIGTEASVAPATLSNAEGALKQGLTDALSNVASQIPAEFIYIPGTLQISYNDIVQSSVNNNSVTLSQTAVASADIVRATDLAAIIAKQKVQGYNGEAVGFADVSKITLALASSTRPTQGILQLTLQGSPTLVWQFDAGALKTALLGKPKSAFETIIQSFAPAVLCTTDTPCSASIRPFWLSSFPSDAGKITIVTK